MQLTLTDEFGSLAQACLLLAASVPSLKNRQTIENQNQVLQGGARMWILLTSELQNDSQGLMQHPCTIWSSEVGWLIRTTILTVDLYALFSYLYMWVLLWFIKYKFIF